MKRGIVFTLAVMLVSGIHIACHDSPHSGVPSSVVALHHEAQSNVVLPNPDLLKCRSGECSQMWDTANAKPGAKTPWRLTVERLGNDPCPNGVIALYDKTVSIEELSAALTERYGPVYLKSGLPGGTWKATERNLVIQLFPLPDEASPETKPSKDAMHGSSTTYFFATDAFHDSVGRAVPRNELKELILLSQIGTSCSAPVERGK